MRQLLLQVPRAEGDRAVALAREHDALSVARVEARRGEDEIELVVCHVSNREVSPLVDALRAIEGAHVAFQPRGVLALAPPPGEAPDQVADVELRSPLEVFLTGVQSVGSWTGFLSYAGVAGAVAWMGLYTGTVYLLTAAMLIAPFAGPAMNAAVATAAGDGGLLRRSLVRYAAALALAVAVAAALSLAVGQERASVLMIEQSRVSGLAVLLPLAAGAAGALNLVQSDRASLVSGAATGMLVAASLAPPAGVLGASVAIGRLDLAGGAAFLLALQLVGIQLVGAVLFRLFGLRGRTARYEEGTRGLFPLATAACVAGLAALLVLQHVDPPELERESLARRAEVEIAAAVREVPGAELVRASATFPRADIRGQDTLLCLVHVQSDGGDGSPAADAVARQLQRHLAAALPSTTPLVSVEVLSPP